MLSALRVVTTVLCFSILTQQAYSQQVPRFRPDGSLASNVQSTITLAVPLDDSKPLEPQQDEVARSFYRYAERSCAIVLDTIGTACELQALNSTITADVAGRSTNAVGARTITINGQITMAVKFKGQGNQP